MPETLEELYPKAEGQYARAEDFSLPKTMKISEVLVRTVKENEKKIVLRFENEVKLLVVNKTNAESLAEKFGKDYTKWVGQTVTLGSVSVTYSGKPTKGIRVIG
jgi:hypothetical protein